MLEIKDITKIYEIGDYKQTALNKVSVNFRKSEFAAILGPSGSGKTTLLNIIGGLDKYTDGDLIINDVSTKLYKDSDWDSYRNHRIGFVFQSYNLISHQTVLQNVVLALTLSGISKKEGIEKAKKALCEVGLEDQIYKKPNQLSGGQMQRVAIARALVNDPDILLADEPTGALDSETSIQIMKVLKNISKDKLVIMVTHNPELANSYANRIIYLKDGKITDDTNPYKLNKNKKSEKYIKTKKTVMSFFTALSLSFNNLMTKKGRTILVSFAGSIGIIGIALIMSLSNGFQNYIDKIQEDTLSSYPLTITNETADMTSMLLSMVSNDTTNNGTNVVSEKQYVSSMFSNISTNDLRSFKGYMEKHYDQIKNDVTYVKYTYSVDPLIYTKNNDKVTKLNPNQIFSSMYGSNSITSLYSSYSSVFSQIIDDQESLDDQYEVLAGSWPTKYNEMVLILSEPNTIPDLLVYFLGLRDMDELYTMISDIMEGKSVTTDNEPLNFTYEELMNIEFKLINPSDTYKYNKKYNIYEDMSDDEEFMSDVYDSSETLKIVGIICPKEGSSSTALSQGVGYTSDLISHIIEVSSESEIVKKQLADTETDVFSNTKFDSDEKENTNIDFEDMISVDTKKLQSAFGMNISQSDISNMTTEYMNDISSSITTDITPAKEAYTSALETVVNGIFSDYLSNPKETIVSPYDETSTLPIIHLNNVETIVNEYLSKSEIKTLLSDLETNYVVPSSAYETTFKSLLNALLQSYITAYYAVDQSLTTDETNPCALLTSDSVTTTTTNFLSQAAIIGTEETMASKMTEAKMQKDILTSVGELTSKLVSSIASSFKVDSDKIASAFKFNMSEEDLSRLISTMMSGDESSTSTSNLILLGYQDLEEPTSISFYFKSFDSKENFIDFIDTYNDKVESQNEEDKVINYTDVTGILMSSVKKVVNSVSYVLIAFVSISLVVSSIMIGIITYISVLERTKEIGILRAIGASKKNISSIFNAETFIIGLLSGLFGVGITLISIPFINMLIHHLTDNVNLNAELPIISALLLIVLSIILTLIGGLIPSKKASKQDPVVALRTE